MSDRSRRVLVVDVGTSSVRAAVVRRRRHARARVVERELLPDSPADGLVRVRRARCMARHVPRARDAPRSTPTGPVDAVGISNQRGSTVVWDRATGEPVGPGLGWQDLRTIGACLALRGEGVRVGPNQSATKVQWLLDQLADRGRAARPVLRHRRHLGRVDALGRRACTSPTRRTPRSPACRTRDAVGVGRRACSTRSAIPLAMMPAIVDSAGVVGEARALPGAPPIAALVGDQQASLVGQGCVRRGDAKITFGTGGMLDVVLGDDAAAVRRSAASTARSRSSRGATTARITWGIEAVMLAAGTNVQWLRDDLGLIASSDESHDARARRAPTPAASCSCPRRSGSARPRGTTARAARSSGSRAAPAAPRSCARCSKASRTAAPTSSRRPRPTAASRSRALRVDGGMTDNPTFVQALADATQRPVEISPVREATGLGAALLAGLAVGQHASVDDLATTWKPRARVEPSRHARPRPLAATRRRARGWIPELSGIDF